MLYQDLSSFLLGNKTKKAVLIHSDLNINLQNEQLIRKHPRFTCLETTINQCIKNSIVIVITSHKGRPINKDPKMSLKFLCDIFSKHYHVKVGFCTHYPSNSYISLIEQKKFPIVLLENNRYFENEFINRNNIVYDLNESLYGMINESFPSAHRSSFFNSNFPKHCKNLLLGPCFKNEIQMISNYRKSYSNVSLLIGGNKLKSKIPIISSINMHINSVYFGGKIAETIIKHIDHAVKDNYVSQLLDLVEQKNIKLHLPIDFVTSTSHGSKTIKRNQMDKNTKTRDIGSETVSLYKFYLQKEEAIIYNGPMGIVEDPIYKKGTEEIIFFLNTYKHNSTLIGGGETSLMTIDLPKSFYHNSIAGGAFLAHLTGKPMPGLTSFI